MLQAKNKHVHVFQNSLKDQRARASIKTNPLDPKAWKKKAKQTAPYICSCPESRHWNGDIGVTDSNVGQEALEGHSSSTTPFGISQVSHVSMLESKPYLLFESLHIKIHISNITLDEEIRHHTCNKISHHAIYLSCILKEYLKVPETKASPELEHYWINVWAISTLILGRHRYIRWRFCAFN